jgi:hypothetical protein
VFKIKFCYDEPLLSQFLLRAFTNTPDELKNDIQALYSKIYSKEVPAFFNNLDTSRFREGINPKKAIEAVMLIIDGLSNKHIGQYKNKSPEEALLHLEEYMTEALEFLDMLKSGIYKQ